jgi:biopolymer transport protein ExbD
MAFSMGNGGSGGEGFGRGRFGRGNHALADMNIVPLVDVVLVLLIIFMLTAHVMEFGLDIKVPEVKRVQTKESENFPVVSITREGKLYLADKPANINELAGRIHKEYPGADKVAIMGDEACPLGIAVNVMNTLNEAKFGIQVVAKPEDFGTRR